LILALSMSEQLIAENPRGGNEILRAPDQPAKTLGFYLLSPAVTLGKAQADSRY